MQLDKASCYALYATVCVAQNAVDRPVQGRTVAGLCEIPFEYLLKILQLLTRGGILASERGRTGGFRLARLPGEITVLEIVETIQGPIRGRAGGMRRGPATRPERMVDTVCREIAGHARERLSSLSVADLMGTA